MDNTQKQLNRLIDAYCLQAEHVERLEQAILIANKAMDICRRVDEYFNSEKQWATGTLEAIYRDAAIVANATTNKGKGGTIGGDRDIGSESKEHGPIQQDCDTCLYGDNQTVNREICRKCSDTGDRWEAIEPDEYLKGIMEHE